MQLANPFPIDVRKQYLGIWACWICGRNGSDRGGLELHHIMGRISDSILNSALLCKVCHEHMNHNQAEEQYLFFLTLKFVKSIGWWLTEKDIAFMNEHKERLFSDEVIEWADKNI